MSWGTCRLARLFRRAPGPPQPRRHRRGAGSAALATASVPRGIFGCGVQVFQRRCVRPGWFGSRRAAVCVGDDEGGGEKRTGNRDPVAGREVAEETVCSNLAEGHLSSD